MKKNKVENPSEQLIEQPETKQPVVEATAEAIALISKTSLKVYTKGGNDVYKFLKDARKYVRTMGKDKTPKSAEALNTAFASIFATE